MKSSNDYSASEELPDFWFLGSLIRVKQKNRKKDNGKYPRIATIHNRITKEETKFDERFQANMRIASQLSEFFPYKWLVEITANLRKIDANKIGLAKEEDRYTIYLGYIEIYLAFRGLTLLESTLNEINNSYGLKISMNTIRAWKIKLIRLIPGLLENYKLIAKQTQQTSITSAVIQIMNSELNLRHCSNEEAFRIKHRALQIAKEFIKAKKARHIKKPEIWARAICFKALKETIPSYPRFPFPMKILKSQKIIENKKWQLDQVIANSF